MSSLAERAAANAERAREKASRTAPDSLDVAREWWEITVRQTGEVFQVFLCPMQTQGWVREHYPRCQVAAIDRHSMMLPGSSIPEVPTSPAA